MGLPLTCFGFTPNSGVPVQSSLAISFALRPLPSAAPGDEQGRAGVCYGEQKPSKGWSV